MSNNGTKTVIVLHSNIIISLMKNNGTKTVFVMHVIITP